MSILLDEEDDMNVQKFDACISGDITQRRHKSILRPRINLQRKSISAKVLGNKRIRKRVSFADGKLVKLATVINPIEGQKVKFEKAKDETKLKSSNKKVKSCHY